MQRTKLRRFMEANDITNRALSEASGVSLRNVVYLKAGVTDPTRGKMAAILMACRQLSGRRRVAITDLFNFSHDAKKVAAR